MCKSGDQCPGPDCPDMEADPSLGDEDFTDAAVARQEQEAEWGQDGDAGDWGGMVEYDPTAHGGDDDEEDGDEDVEIERTVASPVNVYSTGLDEDPPSSGQRKRQRSPVPQDDDSKEPDQIAQDEQFAQWLQKQEYTLGPETRSKKAKSSDTGDDSKGADADASGEVHLSIMTFNINHFSGGVGADQDALHDPRRTQARIEAIQRKYRADLARLDAELGPQIEQADATESKSQSKQLKQEYSRRKEALQREKNAAIAPLKKAIKERVIEDLLTSHQPDVLVLQEVNAIDADDLAEIVARANAEDQHGNTYALSMGPRMAVTGTKYAHKQGTQLESYPIIYNTRRVRVKDEFALVVHESTTELGAARRRSDRIRQVEASSSQPELARSEPYQAFSSSDYKDHDLPWTTHRPVVGQVLEVDALDDDGNPTATSTFVLGTVHTSPSADVQRSSVEYLSAASSYFSPSDPSADRRLPEHRSLPLDVPIVLAGDWYAKDQKVNKVEEASWKQIAERSGFSLGKPDQNTNFPGKGQGMVADFFVGRGVRMENVRAVQPTAPIDQIRTHQTYASDHAPVMAEVAMPGRFVHAQDGHKMGQSHMGPSSPATSPMPGNQTGSRRKPGNGQKPHRRKK